jgi:hypothetical protein
MKITIEKKEKKYLCMDFYSIIDSENSCRVVVKPNVEAFKKHRVLTIQIFAKSSCYDNY